ncbi:hypothetical protein L1987_46823 [Smallanthus sonchifolius]|uniref:Uncharacterized protein n=1 Tax=Smallanthus sonchifolius TaxID=185202 RepID=A0ACB9G0X6_9ASTR|nr:hypothetical protein L1987_46823 [Smallanthus sonchifolius]
MNQIEEVEEDGDDISKEDDEVGTNDSNNDGDVNPKLDGTKIDDVVRAGHSKDGIDALNKKENEAKKDSNKTRTDEKLETNNGNGEEYMRTWLDTHELEKIKGENKPVDEGQA